MNPGCLWGGGDREGRQGGRPTFYHLPLGSFSLLNHVVVLLSWKQTSLGAEELGAEILFGAVMLPWLTLCP